MLKEEVGGLIIQQGDLTNEDTFEYAVALADDFGHKRTTRADLEDHFAKDVTEYYEVYRKSGERIGNVYISARKIGDQTFHTLDGYSDNGTFKDALRAGKWMVDKFLADNDDYFLFTAEEKGNAGAMVLVKRLGFKIVMSNDTHIFYKYDYDKGE